MTARQQLGSNSVQGWDGVYCDVYCSLVMYASTQFCEHHKLCFQYPSLCRKQTGKQMTKQQSWGQQHVASWSCMLVYGKPGNKGFEQMPLISSCRFYPDLPHNAPEHAGHFSISVRTYSAVASLTSRGLGGKIELRTCTCHTGKRVIQGVIPTADMLSALRLMDIASDYIVVFSSDLSHGHIADGLVRKWPLQTNTTHAAHQA